jgi:hypothetical protein
MVKFFDKHKGVKKKFGGKKIKINRSKSVGLSMEMKRPNTKVNLYDSNRFILIYQL